MPRLKLNEKAAEDVGAVGTGEAASGVKAERAVVDPVAAAASLVIPENEDVVEAPGGGGVVALEGQGDGGTVTGGSGGVVEAVSSPVSSPSGGDAVTVSPSVLAGLLSDAMAPFKQQIADLQEKLAKTQNATSQFVPMEQPEAPGDVRRR